MIETDIRIDICHASHQYVEANDKYMKNYDKNNKSKYLKHWDFIWL